MGAGINILFVALLVFMAFFIANQKRLRSLEMSKRLPVLLNRNFKLGYMFYCLFFTLLVVAAIDIKGKAVKTEAPSSSSSVSIIIDFSSSMRVQDVGKARYKMSIDFVKDLTRDLVGSKIRVFVYSDKPYKLVPFTNDLDYVHTKLSAIKQNLFPEGASELHLGLKELTAGEDKSTLLVISDFENVDTRAINTLIEEKNLRFIGIGIGSKDGGEIPRGKNKLLSGVLTSKGKKVISKLSINNLDEINYFKKFVINKASYPTNEVGTLLREINNGSTRESKDNDYLRSRYFHYFIVGSCILLLLSLFYRNIKSPVTFFSLILTLFCHSSFGLDPYEINELGIKYFFESMEKKKKDTSEEPDQSLVLFKENFERASVEGFNKSANYATSLIKNRKVVEGLNLAVSTDLFNSPKESLFLRQNILILLKSEQGRKGAGENESNDSKSKKGKESGNSTQRSSGNQKKHDRKLTDEQRSLLKKLMGDDQVSQAEYIKKNIKLKTQSKGDRW